MSEHRQIYAAVHAVRLNPKCEPPTPQEIAQACVNLFHPALVPLAITLIEQGAVHGDRLEFKPGLEYRHYAAMNNGYVIFVYQWREKKRRQRKEKA